MNQDHRDSGDPHTTGGQPTWLDVVQNKVESLHFGVVQIVVHDSRVVRIERTEKTRLDLPCSC